MRTLCLIFLSLFFFESSFSQDQINDFVRLAGKNYLEKHPNAVLAIGVIEKGEKYVFYLAGEKALQKPDENSKFELGSFTQVFTSILYAELSVKGIVHADDSLQKYLPVNVPAPVYRPMLCHAYRSPEPSEPDYSTKNTPTFFKYTPYVCTPDTGMLPQPILLCYLSTHTSGLPDYPSNLKKNAEGFAAYSESDFYSWLKNFELTQPIGYEYRFSHSGISVLGSVLASKTKSSYAELFNKNLCEPLLMNNTGLMSQSVQVDLLNGSTEKNKKSKHAVYNFFTPASGAYSTLPDMVKFLGENIGGDRDSLREVLHYTHNPRLTYFGKNGEEHSIALGWNVDPLNNDNLNYVWQQGESDGFSVFFGFTETTYTGVVILSSSADPVIEMGRKILKKIN